MRGTVRQLITYAEQTEDNINGETQANVQEVVANIKRTVQDKLEEDRLGQVDANIREAMETSTENELGIERLVEEKGVGGTGEKVVAAPKVEYGGVMMTLTDGKTNGYTAFSIAGISNDN